MNILNYKEPVNFNENINNKLLFERFNVNKPLDNNNYMNFNFGNSFESCHYINFPTINENTINSDKLFVCNKYNQNANANFNEIDNKNELFNSIYDTNEINSEKRFISGPNDFINYINSLKMPLTKFLSTKKGICEMEYHLQFDKIKYTDILLQLLNKEGLTKLMKNKFANYFIQGIIKRADNNQVKSILMLISDNFVEISENISGTYVIQRLLSKINSIELRFFVLKSIENKELEMAFNCNATYVLQKIIEKIPDIERLNLNEIIIKNIILLSINPDCVFIVEKFIDTITIPENKNRIQNIINIHCLKLCNNPYGNYLIQYILKVWKNEDIQNIINIIIENAFYLVQLRYASNVIEKSIEIFGNQNRKKLIKKMCLGGNILDIIKNQYGHYVLNKSVKYIGEDIKIEIENMLNNKMPEMNKKEKSKSKKFISFLKENKPIKIKKVKK